MITLPTWRPTFPHITDKDNIEDYKTKALQGDAAMQYALGRYYAIYREDSPEAIKWLTMAVEQGYTDAQITLANLYLLGVKEKDFLPR